ncbi:hypothetical protein UA08_08077 [Talaromyces atroroseus]|uniref:Protein RTA1 n=1 Tax=Talaromyces atroroseus TaxID=1441469 RepID=A0A225AT46_TALAT|nr:hypothetical protein UA08_08077 [Talaromyces atroroseus]OKL56637.1 hypothetical protein UA08_08077 [Talaromyces atroroseus]
MTKLEPFMGHYYLWYYVPSLVPAIIGTVIFSILTALHMWRLLRARTWFCIPFTIGGCFEVCGYAGTCASHSNTASMAAYAVAGDGTLLAPALFAASIYMTLGRIMSSVKGEKYSVIPIQWLTKLFVLGDILSFVVQGSSLGLTITGHDSWGTVVVELGLVIQVASFGVFLITAVVFHWRLLKSSSCPSLENETWQDNAWLAHLKVLYCISGLIMLRSIFRVILYAGGRKGYTLTHEWLMYVFDFLPMAIVMVVFFFGYPNELIAKDTHELQET